VDSSEVGETKGKILKKKFSKLNSFLKDHLTLSAPYSKLGETTTEQMDDLKGIKLPGFTGKVEAWPLYYLRLKKVMQSKGASFLL
jgi:hypothetical protein